MTTSSYVEMVPTSLSELLKSSRTPQATPKPKLLEIEMSFKKPGGISYTLY